MALVVVCRVLTACNLACGFCAFDRRLPGDRPTPDDARLAEAMALDKKVAAGKVRFVLPERIGSVVMRDGVPAAAVSRAWASIRA